MAERTLNVRIKQKYDTASNWSAKNPVLLAGEIGIESDTNKLKVGNGVNNWNDLLYSGNDSSTGTEVYVTDTLQTRIDFDSDPQTQINNITNNTTKIANSSGGFSAGSDSTTTFGAAIGYRAISKSGGAVGQNAYVENGGGAVGSTARSNSGGAVGLGAVATSGGAVGNNAQAGYGFSGGVNARSEVDAIQLGTGKNIVEKSLQVYNDNLYNANEHKIGPALLNALYPVGSIYISVDDTSPANLFGGTWEQLDGGYTLWTATSDAGETINAGLPNIKGELSGVLTYNSYGDGAFTNTVKENDTYNPSGATNNWTTVKFNASTYNNIYGNSDTVQPPAYKVYAWKRVE